MREKKKIIKILFFIVPISLVLSISFFILKLYYINNFLEYLWTFCINIFAGSLLLLITTIIEYFNNRRNELEKYYIELNKIFFLIKDLKPMDIISEKEIEKYLCFCDYSLSEFDWVFGQIDLLGEKELKNEIRKSYKKVKDFKDLFLKVKIVKNNCAPKEIIIEEIKKISDSLFEKTSKLKDEYIEINYESKLIIYFDDILFRILELTYHQKHKGHKKSMIKYTTYVKKNNDK